MEKETYWSRFARDFEERNTYVAGSRDIAIIKQYISDLKSFDKVLELGCGNGTFSKIIARKSDHVWATDFSDEMVAVTRHCLRKFNNVTIEKQNCFQTTYDNSSFDMVVMVNLLHIIPNPVMAIKESQRILKPGGIMIYILSFTTEGMKLLAKLGMIYRYLKTYGKPPKTAQSLTCETVRGLLIDSGFLVKQSILIGTKSRAVWANADRI